MTDFFDRLIGERGAHYSFYRNNYWREHGREKRILLVLLAQATLNPPTKADIRFTHSIYTASTNHRQGRKEGRKAISRGRFQNQKSYWASSLGGLGAIYYPLICYYVYAIGILCMYLVCVVCFPFNHHRPACLPVNALSLSHHHTSKKIKKQTVRPILFTMYFEVVLLVFRPVVWYDIIKIRIYSFHENCQK